MINNQDNWEKITNLADEYDPKPDLANDAILKLNQRESTVKYKKILPIGCIVALLLLIVTAVLLLSFCNKSNDVLFLSDNDLSATRVENIEKFVEERNLNIYFDNSPNCETQSVVINSDQRLAYIEQKYYFIGAESFENVNLKIILINATYDFSRTFMVLDKTIQVNNIDINYDIVSRNSVNTVYAKFTNDKVDYFLEILNVSNAETTLNGVVLSLINK